MGTQDGDWQAFTPFQNTEHQPGGEGRAVRGEKGREERGTLLAVVAFSHI